MHFIHPHPRLAAMAGLGLALIAATTAFGQAPPPAKPATPAAAAPPPAAGSFPPLSRYAPKDDLLILLDFEGLDSNKSAWENSAMNHVLNDTSTGAMFEEIFVQLVDQTLAARPEPPKFAAVDLLGMFKHISHNGFLAGIAGTPNAAGDDLTSETEIAPIVLRNGARRDVRPLFAKLLGGLKKPAETSAKVVKSGRNVVVNTLPGSEKGWSWWIEGDDLVFAPGSQANADRIIEILDRKRPSAIENPTRQELAKPIGPFKPFLVGFGEVARFPMPPGKFSTGGVKRVDYRWGFEDKAMMSVLDVAIPEPRTGPAKLLDQPSFSLNDLPPIPAGVDGFTVVSIDLAATYGQLVALAQASDPSAAANIEALEKAIQDKTRSRLKEDILGRIGPKIAFYQVPTRKSKNPLAKLSGLGLQIPRMAIVADLKEAPAFSRLFDSLIQTINKQLEAAVPPDPTPEADDAAKKKGGAKAKRANDRNRVRFRLASPDPKTYVLSLPPELAALTNLNLTVAVGKKSLVIATASDAARDALALESKTQGRWSPSPEAKASLERLPKGLTMLQIADPRSTVPETLASLPTTLPVFAASLRPDPNPPAPPATPGTPFPGGPGGGGVPGVSTAQPPPGVVPSGAGGNSPYGPGGGPPGAGGGPPPIVLKLDPSKAPSADAVKKLLFPGSAALVVNEKRVEWVSRASFPNISLTPDSSGRAKILASLLVPRLQSVGGAGDRAKDMVNLKQIGLAAHNYAAANAGFPLASINDKDGKPLLSWRVALLPYLELGPLYNQFKLDEPWDSPHNSKLIAQMPPVYTISSAKSAGPGMTNIRAFVGPTTVLHRTAPPATMATITDGTANTIFAFETNLADTWTKPDELSLETAQGLQKIVGVGRPDGGFLALFADGSVQYLPGGLDDKTVRAMMTINGGEAVTPSSLQPNAPAGAGAPNRPPTGREAR